MRRRRRDGRYARRGLWCRRETACLRPGLCERLDDGFVLMCKLGRRQLLLLLLLWLCGRLGLFQLLRP